MSTSKFNNIHEPQTESTQYCYYLSMNLSTFTKVGTRLSQGWNFSHTPLAPAAIVTQTQKMTIYSWSYIIMWHHMSPNTSECNGGIFLYLYIYVYIWLYVHCTFAPHVHTRVHTLDTFMVAFSSDYCCFATCSEPRYNTSRRALRPSQEEEGRLWHRREREGVQCAAGDSWAYAKKINKVQ